MSFFLLQFCLLTPVFALDTIQVLALFKGKAVIKIDDERYTLSVGETSPEGVNLVAADSDNAVLIVNGKKKTYPLGGSISIGTQFNKADEKTAQAMADRGGMFFIQGSANRHPIRFLIDTGASAIVMNRNQAKRMGIDYRLKGKEILVSTASGTATGYLVKLDSVKVGEINISNVDAIVNDSGFPEVVLLGMSFLSRVEIEREGTLMRIKKKY